jgi:predicted MFS family arabinose efflux permease
VLAGVLPAIAGSLRTSTGAAGLIVTAFTLAYGLGSPVLVALTAGWGRRRVLLGALGVFTLANIGSALAPSLAVLLVTRAVAGAGAGLYSPTAAAVAASLAPPERRGRALALVLGGLQAATVAGVPFGAFIGDRFGWRATMTLVVILGAAAVAALAAGLPPLATAPPPPLRERVAVLAEWPVLRWLLVMLFTAVATLGLYTYLAPVLRSVAGVTAAALPLYILAWGLSVVAGNVLVSRQLDRGRPAGVLLGAELAVLTLADCLLAVAAAPAAALTVLIAFGLACGSVQVPLQHKLLGITGPRGPVAMSLLASALYLGAAAGSGLGSLALTVTGPRQLPLLAAGAALIALLLSQYRHRGRQHRPAVQPAPAGQQASSAARRRESKKESA